MTRIDDALLLGAYAEALAGRAKSTDPAVRSLSNEAVYDAVRKMLSRTVPRDKRSYNDPTFEKVERELRCKR